MQNFTQKESKLITINSLNMQSCHLSLVFLQIIAFTVRNSNQLFSLRIPLLLTSDIPSVSK